MRLTDIELDTGGDLCVVRAVAEYEDSDRGRHDLFVEVPAGGPWAPQPNAEAFFPIVAMAAHAHREQRLAVDAPLDPALRFGIDDAFAQLDAWRGLPRHELRIEAETRTLAPPAEPHATLLMTGGVDSTAALLENHSHFGPGNPRRIDTGLVVFEAGFSFDHDPRHPHPYLVETAARHDIGLVVARTNVRVLDRRVRFWWDHAQTATWSGVAHAFTPQVANVVVGVDEAIGEPEQLHGSDPALDPFFESTHVHLWHGVRRLSRLERVRLIADAGALPTLQVCNRPPAHWEPLNCGRCEKCLRTMVELASIGRLDEAVGFPDTLEPDRVRELDTHSWAVVLYFAATVPGLRAHGRSDLVAAIRHMAMRNRKYQLRFAAQHVDRHWLGHRASRLRAKLTASDR